MEPVTNDAHTGLFGAAVVYCSDGRILKPVQEAMTFRLKPEQVFDSVALAGGGAARTRSDVKHILHQLQLLQGLHGWDIVYLVVHDDCGRVKDADERIRYVQRLERILHKFLKQGTQIHIFRIDTEGRVHYPYNLSGEIT